MIEKTSALLLRVHPFSETSQVAVWLSAEHGRLATLLKGACRPKSPFLGQYDLFYTCELLFYGRDREGLHIAKECAPLNPRPRFRTDWRAFACASYLCGLISAVSFAGGHQPEVFAHTTATLDFLCAHGATAALLFWFELRLSALLGYGPQFGKCAVCAAALAPHRPAFAAWPKGGVACENCARTEPAPGSRLPPDVLAILRRWETARSAAITRRTHCTPGQLLVLQENLGVFLAYHLDLPPAARSTTLAMLHAARPQEARAKESSR
jgi:DNA repair protein RecO (recombination protein O)